MLKGGIVCFIFCFGFTGEDEIPTSDFCQRYERQVITREDVDNLKKLPRHLRDRIQGNEVDYLCQCLKKDLPVCTSTKR
jgi:hypothetical protein